MKKIISLFSCMFLFVLPVLSQGIITVDEAVGLALKNNFSLLIARNDADIARINNAAGNAGMLPSVAVNGSDNYSFSNNIHENIPGGTDYNNANGYSNSLNAEIALNWTLFDGAKMFITKNKLAEIDKLGEIQFKDQVQQMVFNVIIGYYNVVQQKQQLAAIKELMAYSLERVRIYQKKFDAGLGPKTDMLQARIDLNVNKEAIIDQENTIKTAKRYLNQLLSRDPDSQFEVIDSIPLNYKPDPAELAKKLYQFNTRILSSQKQTDIVRLSMQEFKTSLYPKLNFSAGYGFLYSNNNTSTVTLTRSYGPLLGGTLAIPIFQAGNARRQIHTARINLQSAQFDLKNTQLEVNTELQNALTAFDDQQQLLTIEKDNVALAEENMKISLERLRLGETTSLEVRQAQESLSAALARLVSFEYNLKVAETKLRQLVSGL